MPTIPNRHAAAHAVTTEQYTHANALKFMMLATTILAGSSTAAGHRLLKKTGLPDGERLVIVLVRNRRILQVVHDATGCFSPVNVSVCHIRSGEQCPQDVPYGHPQPS